MNIIDKSLTDIKPYENNPRNNDEAVEPVANSIKEFGFKVPIVIDKNNIIVAGHTRYKAAKKLGLETVPCIIADDLNEEQIKAFRLADNKVSEIATWDLELLGNELDNIINIDMETFSFDFLDDIPSEVELERTKDDGEKSNKNYLQFDGKKIVLTDEELFLLNDRYDVYINEHKTNYGFVGDLLKWNLQH